MSCGPHSGLIPFNFFDEINDALEIFNICIDCIFLTDCLKNFLTVLACVLTLVLTDVSACR